MRLRSLMVTTIIKKLELVLCSLRGLTVQWVGDSFLYVGHWNCKFSNRLDYIRYFEFNFQMSASEHHRKQLKL